MATDFEESDTDDDERPAPPKRQCTRLVNDNYDNLNEIEESSDRLTDVVEDDDYDEVEKLAREKLSIWQECQVAKGFLDNTINRVMETYILNPPITNPMDDPQFRLFCDTNMEDTAIMTAIRNHGLVQATNIVCQSQALSARCSSDDCQDSYLRPCSSSCLPETPDFSPLPSSSNLYRATKSTERIEHHSNSPSISPNEDEKMDESDREQDFLERAVAEAIKKKGLSALKVDNG